MILVNNERNICTDSVFYVQMKHFQSSILISIFFQFLVYNKSLFFF